MLLVTLDTTRADRIGACGYRAAQAPRLDGLARRGVLFERALSSAPVTAHISSMTGAYPFTHGARNNGAFSLGDTVPTLPRRCTMQASRRRVVRFSRAPAILPDADDIRLNLARALERIGRRVEPETSVHGWPPRQKRGKTSERPQIRTSSDIF